MLSFLATHPRRTKIAHLNTISFDDGASSIEFKSPSDRYLVINKWPPAGSEEETVPGQAKCALSPPPHWHYFQKETFHMLKGTGKFMLEGKLIQAKAGELVTIPPGAFHTFCNNSMTEGMEVEFTLEPGTRERDEAFFSTLSHNTFDFRILYLKTNIFVIREPADI
jgi:mannose-6-phosphate isomerase-like protein (cupin superfamily)